MLGLPLRLAGQLEPPMHGPELPRVLDLGCLWEIVREAGPALWLRTLRDFRTVPE